MHEKMLAPIETAQSLVEQECEMVASERDAFRAFRDRVAEVEPTGDSLPPGSSLGTPTSYLSSLGQREGTDSPQERVRSAYRETVMSVAHYDQEYDETLRHNLVGEFGADIASGLCDSAPFTEHFKETLQATAGQAYENRAAFLDTLSDEATSLSEAHSTLTDVVQAMPSAGVQSRQRPDAGEVSVTVSDLESTCEETAESRQQIIGCRISVPYLDHHDLCSYLYASESWTFPVLTTTANIARDLRALAHHRGRDRVEFTRRVSR
jgi:hypothetical protein